MHFAAVFKREFFLMRFIIFAVLVWHTSEVCSLAQGYPPGEAVERMTVAAGFKVELVAAEPLVRQPVAIDFDDQGRLWVLQYLQYPNPAGLKRVKVDRFSRTTYDRIPEPPPAGPKGADRLTILEDTNGDGQFDQAKDFISDLNIASGFAFGHGGI
ncbi:MAG TPA: dehydrogenase, partial [Planctomycetaceae bacterium]|nr:dehydrogenase [Planctomycetaceae bacterium]